MPKIVAANCPRCGAGLHIEPGRDRVTCAYCGLSSFVEHEGAPPRVDIPPEFARIIVSRAQIQAAAGLARSGVGCVWAAVTLVIVLAGGGVGVWSWVSNAARGGLKAAGIDPDLKIGGIDRVKLSGKNLHRLDVTEIVQQARASAQAVDSHARLTNVVAHETADGFVDATGENTADVTYEYRYNDPSKPPGKDLVSGEVIFALYEGEFRVVRAPGSPQPTYPDEPRCTSAAAWQTAVKSGVPANAHASMMVYDNRAFSPRSPVVWSVRVEGHDEYRREIDAMSCALVKAWGK